MRLTLRAKGALAFAALSAYVIVVGFVLDAERQRLLDLSIELEQIHNRESDLTRTEEAITHALLRVQVALFAVVPEPSAMDDVALDVELIQSGLRALHNHFPPLRDESAGLSRHAEAFRAGFSRAEMVDLNIFLTGLEDRLEKFLEKVRDQRRARWERYYGVYHRMTFVAITTILAGILVFGTLISIFFSRLAWDIGKLEAGAVAVAEGYRGAPLPETRDDELGGLMKAVNRMQSTLRRNEQQLELVRQRRFHHEKMAAVGSLAAAVAHEINNPIAAIAGVAQSMVANAGPGSATRDDFGGSGPRLILEQAQRISAISRQIAEFTRPGSPQPDLIDLNSLVRSVCKFTGYDQRLRNVEISLDLDPEMPAVCCVADHLTQVLMNLLINSGDALRDLSDRTPAVRVVTRLAGNEAVIAVHDNGHGMEAAVRDRAFEEGFSTKHKGQGMGLGLFLCKALVEGDGGGIELESAPGAGTTVTFRVVLQQPATA